MLLQGNKKNMSTKETIVVSQDCPKFLVSPVTCGSQRVNRITIFYISNTVRDILSLSFIKVSIRKIPGTSVPSMKPPSLMKKQGVGWSTSA